MINYFLAFKKLFFNEKSYILTTGWLDSFSRGVPVGSDGEPLPWMNYAVIDFLKDRLSMGHSLFEYGSGYSTLFYSKRVKKVVSVESDQSWGEAIKGMLPDNAVLSLVDEEKYASSISSLEDMFDVVVVDGNKRPECVSFAKEKLSLKGVIVLDDSHRKEYQDIFLDMKHSGYRSITFSGIKPSGYREYKTTIFYKEGNCFGI